ncbi:hypothetical protein BRC82_01875 [Halobacteriales archaeon QS_1_67_19]|nr:MAG: hypothetical protein BRC82_01875 [Halobacteriales archaeon QS_1_67_19]
MDRDTARPVALALLAVVAIGLAAATLNSAVVTDSSGGFGVGDPDSDAGVQNGSEPNFGLGDESNGSRPPIDIPCYPVLNERWAIGLIVGGFLLGAAAVFRRLGAVGVIAYVGPVGIPLLLAHALLTACVEPPPPGERSSIFQGGNVSLPEGGSGAPGGGSGATLTDPSVLLLLGLGVALLAAVALLFVSSSGDDPEPDADDRPAADDRADVRAVGRAAGDAADRIESSTDVDNEVYRAWREMTRHLDVANPRSSTPAEFAAAAVEAGMDRGDVEELTALFEEVRYGGEAPTAEREQRAVSALRRSWRPPLASC